MHVYSFHDQHLSRGTGIDYYSTLQPIGGLSRLNLNYNLPNSNGKRMKYILKWFVEARKSKITNNINSSFCNHKHKYY